MEAVAHVRALEDVDRFEIVGVESGSAELVVSNILCIGDGVYPAPAQHLHHVERGTGTLDQAIVYSHCLDKLVTNVITYNAYSESIHVLDVFDRQVTSFGCNNRHPGWNDRSDKPEILETFDGIGGRKQDGSRLLEDPFVAASPGQHLDVGGVQSHAYFLEHGHQDINRDALQLPVFVVYIVEWRILFRHPAHFFDRMTRCLVRLPQSGAGHPQPDEYEDEYSHSMSLSGIRTQIKDSPVDTIGRGNLADSAKHGEPKTIEHRSRPDTYGLLRLRLK